MKAGLLLRWFETVLAAYTPVVLTRLRPASLRNMSWWPL